jgi:hypothetical protein
MLLVYSLFDFFGVAATAVFGFRWITALTMMLFGGTATAFLAASSRKRAPISGTPDRQEFASLGQRVDGIRLSNVRRERAD